jgi:hypothetical protein
MAGFIAAAILGGSALTAGAGIYGSMQASQAQQQGIQQAIQAFKTMTAPFREAGTAAISPLMKLLTPGPDMTSTLAQLPGFQFMTDWGTRTAQNLGSKSGQGGNVLKGVADYATGLAQSGWQNLVNPLLGVVQMGAGAASGTGQGLANLFQAGGTAAGAGAMGIANAFGGLGPGIITAALAPRLLGGQQTPQQPGTGGLPTNLTPYAPQGYYTNTDIPLSVLTTGQGTY